MSRKNQLKFTDNVILEGQSRQQNLPSTLDFYFFLRKCEDVTSDKKHFLINRKTMGDGHYVKLHVKVIATDSINEDE